jgi:hypothetical protein
VARAQADASRPAAPLSGPAAPGLAPLSGPAAPGLTPSATAHPSGRPGDQGPSGLPRVYEESPPPEPAGGDGGELATQVYRPPSDEPAGRSRVEPVAVAQAEKRSVPLVLVLIGFLLVGFVLVAGVMMVMR